MPSNSYQVFNKNIDTVERLFTAYRVVDEHDNPSPRRGKRALDHITRAAEIFLVSALEVYLEDILQEVVGEHITCAHNFINLPMPLQTLLKSVPNKYSTEKWIQKYRRIAKDECAMFNTPKIDRIVDLFSKYAAISDSLIRGLAMSASIDPIITYRGKIVHRLRSKEYVKLDKVMDDKIVVVAFVKQFDNMLRDYLHSSYPSQRVPWYKLPT